jgi:hypothetical protein
MENQLDRALQGTLTILTKVQPKDLDAATPCAPAAYEGSIRIAAAAFGADGAMDRTARLPFGDFPGAVCGVNRAR